MPLVEWMGLQCLLNSQWFGLNISPLGCWIGYQHSVEV